MNVSEILSAAADLLEPEGAWTQGAGARDAQGNEAPERSKTATCWCIGGALYFVTSQNVHGSPAHRFLDRMLGESFVSWNDAPERTQAEVVAKLREAAAVARSEGGAA